MTTSAARERIELIFAEDRDKYLVAAAYLGDIELQFIDDPTEARAALMARDLETTRAKYPEATEELLQLIVNTAWPESRLSEFSGEGARHRVVRITFTGQFEYYHLCEVMKHGFLIVRGGFWRPPNRES